MSQNQSRQDCSPSPLTRVAESRSGVNGVRGKTRSFRTDLGIFRNPFLAGAASAAYNAAGAWMPQAGQGILDGQDSPPVICSARWCLATTFRSASRSPR